MSPEDEAKLREAFAPLQSLVAAASDPVRERIRLALEAPAPPVSGTLPDRARIVAHIERRMLELYLLTHFIRIVRWAKEQHELPPETSPTASEAADR
jgi:hypothetical protein